MKRGILYAFLIISNLCLSAKTTSGECPPWVNGDMPPKSNDSYYFMQMDGSGPTLNDAQHDADLLLINSLMKSAGVSVSGSQIEKVLYQSTNRGIDEQTIFEQKYDFELDSVHIAFQAVDRYWVKKGNTYDCKVLYEVAKNPARVNYDPVEYTSKYGARGLWRSAIIPGWGQMYKKSYAKGAIILALEAGTIVTGVVFNNQYNSYLKKSKTTTDPGAIKFYQNKANQAKNLRTGFFVGAAAIYVYNIVDAIAAKGKLRYVKPNGRSLSFSPYIDPELSLGVSIAYTF